MGISVGYLTILFFIGFIFDRDDIRDYAKKEVGELVLNVVIMIILIAIANTLCFERIYEKAFENAMKIKQYTVVVLVIGALVDTMLRALATLSVGMSANGLEIAFQSSALDLLADLLVNGLQTIAILTTTFIVYSAAMEVMGYISFNILIPVGLFFRMLPPLKRVGGALLGVGIVLGFVFPLLYQITAETLLTYMPLVSNIRKMGMIIILVQYIFKATPLAGTAVLKYMLRDYLSVAGIALLLTSFNIIKLLMLLILRLIFGTIGGIVLINFLFTVIGISIFAVMSKEITGLLGERLDVSNITRLI